MARYLITGASRGIGRVLVDVLAADHEVIALGRSEADLRALPVADVVVADLANPGALADALPELGHLDGVVHCAGMASRATLADSDVDRWNRHLTLNVVAPAELTRLLLPALRAAGGTVVFVNSGQGLSASANSTVYAASKFALRAVADALRAEEPAVRVSSVYPGRVATDMQRALRAEEGGPYEPERYIRPDTVAAVIAAVLATPPDAVMAEVTLRTRA